MSELKRTLRALTANSGLRVLVAKVLDIDVINRTVDVEPLDGTAVLFDIKLQAELELESGLVLLPETGSHVIVLLVNETAGVVVSCGEITDFEVSVGLRTMAFDSKGLLLKGPMSNLQKDIGELLDWNSKLTDLLMAVVVTTPAGPGAFDPGTIAKVLELKLGLEPIKAQFKDYLKDS